tara:strand:+ start:129 stop:320 length:192 start_codon:yes stop_codon:yes gene_type:complete
MLRAQSIKEVKKYLVERNLVKAGTLAPNDVLRHMYEEAILTGKVSNTGGQAEMHNYMHQDKPV